jgi:hypothetical protein
MLRPTLKLTSWSSYSLFETGRTKFKNLFQFIQTLKELGLKLGICTL